MMPINFVLSQGCQQRILQQDVTKSSGYHMGALFFPSSTWQWGSGFSASLAKTNKVSNILCSLHLIFIPSTFYCYYYFFFFNLFFAFFFCYWLSYCLFAWFFEEGSSDEEKIKNLFIYELPFLFIIFFQDALRFLLKPSCVLHEKSWKTLAYWKRQLQLSRKNWILWEIR